MDTNEHGRASGYGPRIINCGDPLVTYDSSNDSYDDTTETFSAPGSQARQEGGPWQCLVAPS